MAIRTAIYDHSLGGEYASGSPKVARWDVTYEGCVLATGEINGYHDSDFYAVVWDAEAQEIKRVEYATTRGYTYDNSATVDATLDTLAAVVEYLVRQFAGQSASAAWKAACTVEKGKDVRVVKGRKVKPGTEGRVFWLNRETGRAGIEKADGERVFVALEYLEVVDPSDWFTFDLATADAEDRKLAEQRFANSYGWDTLRKVKAHAAGATEAAVTA